MNLAPYLDQDPRYEGSKRRIPQHTPCASINLLGKPVPSQNLDYLSFRANCAESFGPQPGGGIFLASTIRL